MMVGGNRGEMQSAKTSSPSLFVTVSLSPSQAHSHTYTKKWCCLIVTQHISVNPDSGKQGTARQGGRERERERQGQSGGRWKSVKSMGKDMGGKVESRGKGLTVGKLEWREKRKNY